MRLGIMRKSKSAASIRSKRKQKKKKRKKEEEEASDSDYISLSPLAIYSSDSDQYPTAVRGQIANTPQSTKLVKTYSRREPLKTRRFGDLGSEFDALREFDVYASGDKEVRMRNEQNEIEIMVD